MRRKSVKHEKLATLAFVLAILIAVVAFYFVWQNIQYGRSLEGLQKYACVKYLQEHPGETVCPDFTLVQPQQIACCCDTGGTSRFHKYQAYASVPKTADDFAKAQACTEKCSEGGPKASLINVGRCSWIEE
ncbi:hypothetical protein KY309_03655 [Candidatus Woesearchaeota archaeon]|nr:hypothetical protein [Candidatus Woesearchaeota archaeon]MBW3016678.1 hypothetical protein [Candidatus Woesearchaeota archaeon]